MKKIAAALMVVACITCMCGCTKDVTDYSLTITAFGEEASGTYTGTLEDGQPVGTGVFKVENEDGGALRYEGEFADNTFNGKGKISITGDGKEYSVLCTFKDGNLRPTVAELFSIAGMVEGREFNVSEKAMAFLEEHPKIFKKHKKDLYSKYIDSSITYQQLSKNAEKYGDRLITADNLYVLQISESENSMFGYETMTSLLLVDTSIDKYYSVEYIGEVKGVYEGDYVSLVALPLDYYSYENVSGGNTWAVACAGAAVK